MLSDEEKKAIEYWQYIRDTQIYDGYIGQVYSVVLLNLIEKQSNEIEELKAITKQYLEKNKIHDRLSVVPSNVLEDIIEKQQKEIEELKDKIKAKIEEYDEMINATKGDFTVYGDRRKDICLEIKCALQSLLEKE